MTIYFFCINLMIKHNICVNGYHWASLSSPPIHAYASRITWVYCVNEKLRYVIWKAFSYEEHDVNNGPSTIIISLYPYNSGVKFNRWQNDKFFFLYENFHFHQCNSLRRFVYRHWQSKQAGRQAGKVEQKKNRSICPIVSLSL